MLVSLLTLALHLLAMPAGVVPAPDLRADLSGDWELVESPQAVQAQIDQAVEQAAQEFFWGIRPLVRLKLREGAAWCPQVHLELEPDQLRLACPGQQALVRRLDDSEGPQTLADGRVIDTEIALPDPRTLEVKILGEEGGYLTRYHSLAADRLRVEVAVSSPYLRTPMRWTLYYQRAGARHAAAR